jgi:hypothetical protein
MSDQPRESNRLVKPVQGDLYAPYGPEDGWMFRYDPDAAEEQGARFGRAIKNGIKALRQDGKKVYAEDLGARPRRIPASAPLFDEVDEANKPDPIDHFGRPQSSPTQQEHLNVPAPEASGLVDQHGRPYDPRREQAPPRAEPNPTDFEPFDPHAAWEREMRRAEAAVRGETLVEPEPEEPMISTDPRFPKEPEDETQNNTLSTQLHPSSEMKPQAVSPTYPEFLNADGTVPRRPCGATTVITLRNRDHVIECQEEVRDATADHPHYGLPHLALITTGKRGHRVFIGWHEEE